MLNENQLRRFAVKGKVLGRRTLSTIASIVTPDTIRRWHRQLVATKHDYSDRLKKSGRELINKEVCKLVAKG